MRFVIRQPLPQDLDDGEYSMSTRLANEKPDHYAEIKEKIQANPIQTGDKNINVVFRDMFGIDYHRLIARNDIQNTKPPANTFFLCFIPQGIEDYEKDDPAKRMAIRLQTSKEHDCFVEFLEANGAEEIYSMQGIGSLEVENNGAWDYFRHNVKSGAIVVSITPTCIFKTCLFKQATSSTMLAFATTKCPLLPNSSSMVISTSGRCHSSQCTKPRNILTSSASSLTEESSSSPNRSFFTGPARHSESSCGSVAFFCRQNQPVLGKSPHAHVSVSGYLTSLTFIRTHRVQMSLVAVCMFLGTSIRRFGGYCKRMILARMA